MLHFYHFFFVKTATAPKSVLCDSCSMLYVMESNMNGIVFLMSLLSNVFKLYSSENSKSSLPNDLSMSLQSFFTVTHML